MTSLCKRQPAVEFLYYKCNHAKTKRLRCLDFPNVNNSGWPLVYCIWNQPRLFSHLTLLNNICTNFCTSKIQGYPRLDLSKPFSFSSFVFVFGETTITFLAAQTNCYYYYFILFYRALLLFHFGLSWNRHTFRVHFRMQFAFQISMILLQQN